MVKKGLRQRIFWFWVWKYARKVSCFLFKSLRLSLLHGKCETSAKGSLAEEMSVNTGRDGCLVHVESDSTVFLCYLRTELHEVLCLRKIKGRDKAFKTGIESAHTGRVLGFVMSRADSKMWPLRLSVNRILRISDKSWEKMTR